MANYIKGYSNAIHSVLRFIGTAAIPFILGALLGAHLQHFGSAGSHGEGIRELHTTATNLQQELADTTSRLEHAHQVIESNNWRARELAAKMAIELERQLASAGTASELIAVLRGQIEGLSNYYSNTGSVSIVRDSNGRSYTSDEIAEALGVWREE